MIKKYFTIQWNTALLWLVPPILRKTKQVAWIKVLLTPLMKLYDNTFYKMQHNGQVAYLEKVLNDTFNPNRAYTSVSHVLDPATGNITENGFLGTVKAAKDLIFIEDAFRPKPLYLYTRAEIEGVGESPIYTYTTDPVDSNRDYSYFLYLSGDLDFSSIEYFDFRIYIPKTLGLEYTAKLEEINDSYDSLIADAADQDAIDELNRMRNKEIAWHKTNSSYLRYTNHPTHPHQDAIYIHTPKFHDTVNYYRLASKSYETIEYDSENL